MNTKVMLYLDDRYANHRQNMEAVDFSMPLLAVGPDDLVQPGWLLCQEAGRNRLVADGETIEQADVAGIINLVPAYSSLDFPGYIEGDAEYVAAEVNAFLSAFLFSSGLRVLNRPGPSCLSGPNYGRARWLANASAIPGGHSLLDYSLLNHGYGPDDSVNTILIIGDSVFGKASAEQVELCMSLARQEECNFLKFDFLEKDGRQYLFSVEHAVPDDSAVYANLLQYVDTAWMRCQ